MSEKATNPKDAIGSDKLPLHLWPATATAMGSIGLLNGMLKYGRANWRHAGVRASIYYDAVGRHLNAWFEGEEVDPDDGVPHLAAALACLAIIVDAQAAGKLNDDRQTTGGYHKLMQKLSPHVPRLKEIHGSKTPRHYTIADNLDALERLKEKILSGEIKVDTGGLAVMSSLAEPEAMDPRQQDLFSPVAPKAVPASGGNWLKWNPPMNINGVVLPVSPHTVVEYELRSGARGEDFADNIEWSHSGSLTDIVRYRAD